MGLCTLVRDFIHVYGGETLVFLEDYWIQTRKNYLALFDQKGLWLFDATFNTVIWKLPLDKSRCRNVGYCIDSSLRQIALLAFNIPKRS